jgi:hypothetical protein
MRDEKEVKSLRDMIDRAAAVYRSCSCPLCQSIANGSNNTVQLMDWCMGKVVPEIDQYAENLVGKVKEAESNLANRTGR